MNDAQEIAQPLLPDRADALPRGQEAEASRAYYVQWVKHTEVAERSAKGWSVAGGLCHHNMYAVLMRAPEGWEP